MSIFRNANYEFSRLLAAAYSFLKIGAIWHVLPDFSPGYHRVIGKNYEE